MRVLVPAAAGPQPPGAAASAAARVRRRTRCMPSVGPWRTHEPAPEGTAWVHRSQVGDERFADAVAGTWWSRMPGARTKATPRVEDHRRMLRLRDYDPREGAAAAAAPRSGRSGGSSVRTRATPTLTGTLALGGFDQPRAQQLWLVDIWGIDCMQEVWAPGAGQHRGGGGCPAPPPPGFRASARGPLRARARLWGTRPPGLRAQAGALAGPEPGLRRRVARGTSWWSPLVAATDPRLLRPGSAAPPPPRGPLRRQRAAVAPLVR